MQKENNVFDNDFRIIQSAKILSIYGINVKQNIENIVKSEQQPGQDDEQSAKIKKAESDAFADAIEKGIVSNALANGYGVNEPMKFTKTGKELKEKLPNVLISLNNEKTTLESQMIVIRTKIGIDPANLSTSYVVKGIAVYRYPWEMCDRVWNDMEKKYEDATDQQALCCQYNSLANVWMDLCEDIACVQVIQANLEDGKKYTLSVNQLIALSLG